MANRRIDPRVEIGFVRLPVGDLDRALVFYQDGLGFDVTQRIGHSSAILSAGGYHPHLFLHADGQSPGTVPVGSVCRFGIRYPDRESLASALAFLEESRIPLEAASDFGLRESLFVRDPDGNAVELYCDRTGDQWPREADGTLRLVSQPLDVESLRRAARTMAAERAAVIRHGESPAPLSEPTRARLADMRLRLLNLHKVLLDDAKAAYEMDRGRVGSNASLLQLVINDPWFAWLHPLSELIVRIDETLQADAPATESDGVVLLDQVERLLSPGQGGDPFAQRYYEALQRQPAVIVAHAEVRRILKQAK
jgi:catechol 2,3-dioxygenase